MDTRPQFSVVVVITDGAPNLGRCLSALQTQRGAPPLEILVPVHPILDEPGRLQAEYPWVRFVAVENLPFARKPSDAGLRHIIYDLRRAAGLRAALGDIIAMTEDHAIPPPDWCAGMAALHAALPHAAIGGAIDCAGTTYLAWAGYFGEFIRYQNPAREGPSEYVSDVNVSYKRQALEQVRAAWSESYHETSVHAALKAAGQTLWLARTPYLLHDRGRLSLGPMCRERVGWARVFAGRRAQTMGFGARAMFALFSPGLPLLFLIRRWYVVMRTGRSAGRLFLATPVLLLLFSFWAYGEMLGYLTARPFRDGPGQLD